MPYPTADEAEIYKANAKMFQTRCLVRLDHSIFTSPFHDHFEGTTLDFNKWNAKTPSWTYMTIAGSTVKLGEYGLSISSAWISSKENIAFPRNTNTDWVLDARFRFETITGYGVFFRICSLEDVSCPLNVECQTNEGFHVEMPLFTAYRYQTWNAGAGYGGWVRVRVVYDALDREYTVTLDTDDDGVYEEGPWTLSAVNARADYIVIGNSTARQGFLGPFTTIEVDYVTVTGTSEAYDLPDWAGPQYLYDSIGYDTELWAPLPSVLRGNITVHKDNITDALSLDLINFANGYDYSDPRWRIYTGFNFLNRGIRVQSRVSDFRHWTPWRTIFVGNCDEKNVDLRPNGDCILTLNARDAYRKHLAEMHIIRAYAKCDDEIDGLYRNMVVSDIIYNIAQDACGLPYSAIDSICTPYNYPQTFNVAGDSAANAIKQLLDSCALCWYTEIDTGRILVRDYFYGTDTPGYRLSTAEEIETVQWTHSNLDALGIVEFAVENTEFENGGFSTNHPQAPVPFYGRVMYTSSIAVQDDPSLQANPVHQKMWKRENRNLGSITIEAQCQDWVEHDLEIGVRDDKYLGIKDSDGPWVIDGWTHEWEGTQSFTTTINLVTQHPDRNIRDSIRGYL